VFAVLGLGMALPYLAASLVPALAHRLPRPGAWMQHFKVAMAFPMFATVVWLLWVLGLQVGVNGVARLLAVLVALAFAAWTLTLTGIGRTGRLLFGGAAVVVLAGSVAWAWPGLKGQLDSTASSAPAAGQRWQPWSAGAVSQAHARGRPVFVDFTAAWCVTCQVNKLTTLSNAAVLADFDQRGVQLMRADWTRRDPLITAELARLGRSGVPVYALYVAGETSPRVLSEVLSVAEIRLALADVRAAPPSALSATSTSP
jgi:thiol:disulfide interchange protein DsbD